MIYRLCKSMIAKGMTEGMRDKLDVFFAVDRLTQAEYAELCGMLAE